MFLYLTLYIQGVLDYSPLEAGLRFLPLTLLSFFVAPISGRAARTGSRRGRLMGTGLILVGARAAPDARDRGRRQLDRRCCPASCSPGSASGMTNPGIASVAIGVVEPARAGMASGINSTFRQVGIATGVAGARRDLPDRGSSSKLAELLPQAPDAFAEAVASGAAQSALAAVPAAVPRAGRRRRQHRVHQRASTRSCSSAPRSRSSAGSPAGVLVRGARLVAPAGARRARRRARASLSRLPAGWRGESVGARR